MNIVRPAYTKCIVASGVS
ncbi:hypothetical protein D046_0864A, partial [Vibrio parahaemolyticus V-223/04]